MHDTPSKASYTSGLFAFFIGRIADMFSNVNWADVASVTGIVNARQNPKLSSV